jgi:hypothetical protein
MYILLPCGDAPVNLIKTIICRVGVLRNVITLFSTKGITTINNRHGTAARTAVLAVDKVEIHIITKCKSR